MIKNLLSRNLGDTHVDGDFPEEKEARDTNFIQHDEGTFSKVGEFDIEQRAKKGNVENNYSLQEEDAELFGHIDGNWDYAEKENVHAGVFAKNEFGDGDDLRTPTETIKGVQKTLNFSPGDEVTNCIMSVTREIQSTHDTSDKITEK